MTDDMRDPADSPDRSEGRAFADGRILLVALRGWNDAGEAASGAVSRVRKVLAEGQEVLWECDDEEFFDYSLNRPHVEEHDGVRRLHWPSLTVTGPAGAVEAPEALADDADLQVSGANPNVFVLLGTEPTLRWKTFTRRVLDFIDEHAITRVVLVGALLNDSPHSRPTAIFASSDDAIVREELGVGRSEYEGPTGVLGVLSAAVREREDVLSLSLWAAVPHYAPSAPSPKAASALLDRLEELLDLTVPHARLVEASREWESELDELTSADSDLAEYIAALEGTYDTVEAPEASGEAIAREFERFLQQSAKPGPSGQASSKRFGRRGPSAKPDPQEPEDRGSDADEDQAGRPDDGSGDPA